MIQRSGNAVRAVRLPSTQVSVISEQQCAPLSAAFNYLAASFAPAQRLGAHGANTVVKGCVHDTDFTISGHVDPRGSGLHH
jgi:hypothetical protein